MGRYALLIGVSEFQDPRLRRLHAPSKDVEMLGSLLKDEEFGHFDEVVISVEKGFVQTRDQILDFFDDRNPTDLVFLYYSGHGILERGGDLYLATSESNCDAPGRRSVAAREVRDRMEKCRATRQIILLDCCHSGSFPGARKGRS